MGPPSGRPPGLGSEVGHVAVHAAKADGLPLRSHDAGKIANHGHVSAGGMLSGSGGFFSQGSGFFSQGRGGEARFFEEFGEGGESTGRFTDTEAGVRIDVVPGIRPEDHRDAEARAFAQFLHGVGESCQFEGRYLASANRCIPGPW